MNIILPIIFILITLSFVVFRKKIYNWMKKNIKKAITILVSIGVLSGGIVLYPVDDGGGSNPPPAAGWWDTDWDYYVPLSTDASQVNNTLSNFPILVNCTDTTLIAKCQANGEDIRFIGDDNSTEYYYEIDNWSPGGFDCWVNLTSISDSGTSFNMYYGNDGASDAQSTSTWDSSFSAVYHMNASTTTTNGCYDSTANENHGTFNGNMPTTGTGMIGEGQYGGDSPDYIRLPAAVTSEPISVEAWYDSADVGDNKQIIFNEYDDASNTLYLMASGDTQYEFVGSIDTTPVLDIEVSTRQAWYEHWSFRAEVENDADAYINGSHIGTDTTYTLTAGSYDYAVIGLTGTEVAGHLYGNIDEVRIHTIARSEDWLITSFNTQVNKTTFIGFGTESSAPEDGENDAPDLNNESPTNETTGQSFTPIVNVTCDDDNGDTMNASWWWSDDDVTYTLFATNTSITAGESIQQSFDNATAYYTTYYWRINISDGNGTGTGAWVNETYHFTTEDYTTAINVTDESLSNRAITFAGDPGDTVYCNTSGTGTETPCINITINSVDERTDLRIYIGDLDAVEMPADDISIQFSSDNTTWGANWTAFTAGGSFVRVNDTLWSEANSMYGATPFVGGQFDVGFTDVFFRLKLDIDAACPVGTYSVGIDDWYVELGHIT